MKNFIEMGTKKSEMGAIWMVNFYSKGVFESILEVSLSGKKGNPTLEALKTMCNFVGDKLVNFFSYYSIEIPKNEFFCLTQCEFNLS